MGGEGLVIAAMSLVINILFDLRESLDLMRLRKILRSGVVANLVAEKVPFRQYPLASSKLPPFDFPLRTITASRSFLRKETGGSVKTLPGENELPRISV